MYSCFPLPIWWDRKPCVQSGMDKLWGFIVCLISWTDQSQNVWSHRMLVQLFSCQQQIICGFFLFCFLLIQQQKKKFKQIPPLHYYSFCKCLFVNTVKQGGAAITVLGGFAALDLSQYYYAEDVGDQFGDSGHCAGRLRIKCACSWCYATRTRYLELFTVNCRADGFICWERWSSVLVLTSSDMVLLFCIKTETNDFRSRCAGV